MLAPVCPLAFRRSFSLVEPAGGLVAGFGGRVLRPRLPGAALVGGAGPVAGGGPGVPDGVVGLGRFGLALVVQARCFSGFRV